jgi:hypothetical protein
MQRLMQALCLNTEGCTITEFTACAQWLHFISGEGHLKGVYPACSQSDLMRVNLVDSLPIASCHYESTSHGRLWKQHGPA